MNYEQIIQEIADAYEAKNKFFWRVAPLAAEIYYTNGQQALKEATQDVKEAIGSEEVSFYTLESYAWTWQRIKDLNIPEDLTVHALRKIAAIKGKDKRQQFVNQVIEKGLSSSDVLYLLKYK